MNTGPVYNALRYLRYLDMLSKPNGANRVANSLVRREITRSVWGPIMRRIRPF